MYVTGIGVFVGVGIWVGMGVLVGISVGVLVGSGVGVCVGARLELHPEIRIIAITTGINRYLMFIFSVLFDCGSRESIDANHHYPYHASFNLLLTHKKN
jgi:hypothetical protein